MLEFNDLINNYMLVGHLIKKVKRITSLNVCEMRFSFIEADCVSFSVVLLKDGLLDGPSY